jgi:hypothetical protein
MNLVTSVTEKEQSMRLAPWSSRRDDDVLTYEDTAALMSDEWRKARFKWIFLGSTELVLLPAMMEEAACRTVLREGLGLIAYPVTSTLIAD